MHYRIFYRANKFSPVFDTEFVCVELKAVRLGEILMCIDCRALKNGIVKSLGDVTIDITKTPMDAPMPIQKPLWWDLRYYKDKPEPVDAGASHKYHPSPKDKFMGITAPTK